jgi:hypothetical protein
MPEIQDEAFDPVGTDRSRTGSSVRNIFYNIEINLPKIIINNCLGFIRIYGLGECILYKPTRQPESQAIRKKCDRKNKLGMKTALTQSNESL